MFSIKLSGAALVMSLLAVVARAEAPAADLSKENAELKARIEKLDRQVKELNRKLLEADRALQLARANAAVGLQYEELRLTPPATMPSTLIIPDRPKMPRGAVEHRFNGDVFYVIPIETNVSTGYSSLKTTTTQQK